MQLDFQKTLFKLTKSFVPISGCQAIWEREREMRKREDKGRKEGRKRQER